MREVIKVIQRIAHETRKFTIREDVIIFSDGRQEVHEILQSPEGVLVLPITQGGNIILTKEQRHHHGLVYGVPMGRKEKKDVDFLEAAQRELQEETGLSATTWTLMSTHHNGVHEDGLNCFYLAEGLSMGEVSLNDDEIIEMVEMSFTDAFHLMEEGKIPDLPSRACIWAGYITVLGRNEQISNT